MPGSDYTTKQTDPGQFKEAQNQAYAVLAAICGPEVAMAFSRYYGKNISPDQIVDTARDFGYWTSQSGMRGPQAQKALLDKLGIPTDYSPEVNNAALQQAIVEGRTGAISTPNHYFFIQGYDPNTGLYDTGNTGTVYRGGSRWMTLDQIKQLGGGSINGVFTASNTSGNPMPTSNQPSQPTQGTGVVQAPQRPTGLPNLTGQTRQAAGTTTPTSGPIRSGTSYNGGGISYDDKEAVKQYIRYAAAQRNIDPDVAVKVAESEGLNTYIGDNGSSFGPYQLHYGNVAGGGNAVGGVGDTFTQKTGLDARDPTTVQAQIDFALDQAKSGGWGPWHGAARVGVGNYTGIGTYSGDPNQFGNYGTYQSTPTAANPNPVAGGPAKPTGLPSDLSNTIPMITMGSSIFQGPSTYNYPTTPTVTPPLVPGSGNGWI